MIAVVSSICCSLLASMFFFLFRNAFQSVSTQNKMLINIIFYHLSVLYQCLNIVSTVFIISTISDVFDEDVSVVLFNIRQWLLIAILATLSCISIARVFSHFWVGMYLGINHTLLGRIFAFLIILHPCMFFVLKKIVCNSYGFGVESAESPCSWNLAIFAYEYFCFQDFDHHSQYFLFF